MPAVTVSLLGDGAPNEKSHVPPKKPNVSAFVFPFTGSAMNTGTPPLQTTSAAGTVALRLVAPEGVVESAFPLKLIADWGVEPVPVDVSENVAGVPLAEVGFTAERL